MSPARPPSAARAGIRNAALRDAAAEPAPAPAALQPGTEPGAVPIARYEPAETPPSAAAAARGKPTRITVDLAGELYGFLRGYAQARDVAAADVIRELLRQARADPELSARITAELERRREALAEAMRAARE